VEGGTCTPGTGKALKFAGGINDLLTGDLGTDLPGGNSSRTVEVWAKYTSDTSWKGEGTVIELGRKTGAANMVFGIDMAGRVNATSGKFDPYTNGFGDNDGTVVNAPSTGWHHLSFAYEGTTKKFQFTFDGVATTLAKSMGGASDMLATTPGIVTLGGSQSFGTTGWDGVLDEVRVWTISRSVADIARDMKIKLKGTEPGLAAYYHLDEGSGDVADDVSGKTTHRLTLCTAASAKCAAVNTAKPVWTDSDIPGSFTCAQ